MTDNLKIQLKGKLEVSILSKNDKEEIILNDDNQIESGAIEILTRCLSQLNFSKSLDVMEAIGDFGAVEKFISIANFPAENQIQLTCIFEETDFNGTVTDLKMKSSSLGLVFSSKTGLSITKDDDMRLRVRWTITIN